MTVFQNKTAGCHAQRRHDSQRYDKILKNKRKELERDAAARAAASLYGYRDMKNKYKTIVFSFLLAGCLAVSCNASEAETENNLVATSDEMAPAEDVVDENMTPIEGTDVEDGTYEIEVDSSSSMFRIVKCELNVKDGEMTAVMTMSGDGYLRLYMGTGEEAVEASEEAYIYFEEDSEGRQTYEVPVEALDKGIDCAAWSKKKEKWYDRTLVFKAASLPQDALKESALTKAEDLNLEDGTYQVEVSLEGGSGRTSVESPTQIKVEDGKVTAQITFSSPYYDYMLVDGVKYEMVNTEGNSTFEIPVTAFDWGIAVTADTVAMSTPHEIDYTLYFDSSSIKEVSE